MPGIGLKAYLDQFDAYLKKGRESFARWIVAGVVRVDRRYRGRIYLTLVDPDSADQGNTDAVSVGAVLKTAGDREQFDESIFDAEGGPLRKGQKVLLHVAPILNRRGQLSLDVLKVDTQFSLGELKALEIETRQALKHAGIYTRNRELPTPIQFLRIAIIAPTASQGLEDFVSRIRECTEFGVLEAVTYQTVCQGERAKQAIPETITRIAQDGPFNVVFIVRGGGSAQDLSVWNDFAVAEAICRCPIPIWTGIGHQVDVPIAQEVAHRGFGTPSKAAEALVQRFAKAAHRLFDRFTFIAHATEQLAQAERQALVLRRARVMRIAAELADSDREQLIRRMRQIAVRGEILADRARLELESKRIELIANEKQRRLAALHRSQIRNWKRAALALLILLGLVGLGVIYGI